MLNNIQCDWWKKLLMTNTRMRSLHDWYIVKSVVIGGHHLLKVWCISIQFRKLLPLEITQTDSILFVSLKLSFSHWRTSNHHELEESLEWVLQNHICTGQQKTNLLCLNVCRTYISGEHGVSKTNRLVVANNRTELIKTVWHEIASKIFKLTFWYLLCFGMLWIGENNENIIAIFMFFSNSRLCNSEMFILSVRCSNSKYNKIFFVSSSALSLTFKINYLKICIKWTECK